MDVATGVLGFGLVVGIGLLLFAGLVVALIVWSAKARRTRQAEVAAFAAARGWDHHPSVPALLRRWRSAPFGYGSSRSATEVLTGSFHGRQAMSLTYTYVTGSGDDRTTHHCHVVAMQLPVPLPWLHLTPEGAGSAVAKFFGGQDVTFESEAFNEAWRVKAPPGPYAHDVIHPRMMERLMAADALGRPLTVEGQDLFVWTTGRQRLDLIDTHLNLLYGIIEQIPRHVWLKAGYDPAARG